MTRNRLSWIIVAALAVRLAMIFWSLSGAYITPQVGLSERYFREGYAIDAGWGYSTDEEPLSSLTPAQQRVERGEAEPGVTVSRPAGFYGETLHPPGFSLLVAAIHRIFGGNASLLIMVLGALLDSLAAAILYLMIRAVWSEGVAFATGITYALFLPQAYAVTADRLPNGIVSLFLIGSLACVFYALADRRRVYLWFAAAGLVIGIGGYMRPDYDLLAVGLFPFVWLYARNFRRSVQATGLMLLVTCVTLLPWAYRNHQLYGQWTFTSSAVGSTLVEGLGRFNNPWGVGYSDDWLTREASAHGFKSAWTLEADDYFSKLFAKDVREHPLAYVGTIVKGVPLVVAPAHLFGFVNPLKTKTFTQQRSSGIDRYQALLREPLYIVSAYWDALIFAVLSFTFLVCSIYMLFAERRRFAVVALLMAPHLYGLLTHLISDPEPRYLLPSTFCLMIGFGYCVNAVLARNNQRVVPATAAYRRSSW
jgi:hypothetical protein